MYLNYNTDQIHMLFSESKKCIFAYIYGKRKYNQNKDIIENRNLSAVYESRIIYDYNLT
jgi:hypothetical protein